jgi:hypothetical protein
LKQIIMFRWFTLLNSFFLALILVAALCLGLLILPSTNNWEVPRAISNEKDLPSYFKEQHCIEELGEGPLELKWVEPKIQLPNLQQTLVYYGVSARPDLSTKTTYLHLALYGDDQIRLFDSEKPIYLSFEGNIPQSAEGSSSFSDERLFTAPGETIVHGHYTFSKNNEPTPLWIEFVSNGVKQCLFKVKMLDESGAFIESPSENQTLFLNQKEIPKSLLIGWEMGEYHVDSTLLLRQKARWIGSDRFLEMHGGEEYARAKGKQRIDFLGAELPYSCFVSEGEALYWKEGKWAKSTGEQSIGAPLLVVSKIEENVIHFKLWDPEGKGAIQLNLVRAKDVAPLPKIEDEFKFIGAKTWSKFIVESRDERYFVKAHDWLLLNEERTWVALDNKELVQQYVDGELRGPLLILEKLIKTQGEQTLVGHLFNASRTEAFPVCLRSTPTGYFGNTPYYPPIKDETLP